MRCSVAVRTQTDDERRRFDAALELLIAEIVRQEMDAMRAASEPEPAQPAGARREFVEDERA